MRSTKKAARRARIDLPGFVLDEPGSTAFAEKILAVARTIPRGRVTTYGQLAELAGIPRGHRIAARTMKVTPKGVPWQRVLGRKDARRAEIKIQDPEHAARQRKLLVNEGVRVDEDGSVSLREFGWLPL